MNTIKLNKETIKILINILKSTNGLYSMINGSIVDIKCIKYKKKIIFLIDQTDKNLENKKSLLVKEGTCNDLEYNFFEKNINHEFINYGIINSIITCERIYNIFEKIINNQKDQDKKVLQCVSICNSLIKSNIHRPYNYTEDIMSQY